MVSSIAAAGLYKGTWREDMFDEAEDARHPPLLPHQARVRADRARGVPTARGASTGPGSSSATRETGEMDKVDGPYYFFKLLQRARNVLPRGCRCVGVEGGEINIVPVDYVADGDGPHRPPARARRPGLPPHRPEPQSAGEVINIFAQAADAPQAALRLDSRMHRPRPPR